LLRPSTNAKRLEVFPDELQCTVEQLRMISFMNPATRPRRVRQRNRYRFAAVVRDRMYATDQLLERKVRKKASNREPADRDQQLRLEQRKLRIEPY
jgi:hypothetical protein